MTKSTRYFVFVAVIILVAGLGTGLVAYFMGFRASAFARRTGPDELQYVPRDVAVVAFANVRDVMNSQLRQKIRNLEPSEEGRHDFEEKTGINIETDVDHVVACLGGPNVPSHTGSDEMDGGLVLATGRFNEFKIENLMREHGGRIEEYKGKRLVTHPGDNLPGHEGEAGPAYRRRHPEGLAVAFIEPTTVA